MKVRNIVRKAAVLGSSAALVGTTLMGALAYDLGTYPAKYIVDGQFDGKIVVGENAATADVLGAIDIAASLQAASVKKVPIAGDSAKSSFEGDAFELSSSSDQIELREFIGDVVDTITEDNLAGLKSGQISTSEGDTDYFQYLRLKDGTNLQNMSVNYLKNDETDETADFLIVDTNQPFLEWEIQFPEGAESEVEGTFLSGSLEDLEDRSFNIMGTDFSIVQADIAGGDEITLTLMGGSVADTLREGETRTYSIGGVDYEVTLVFVSDPSTSGGSNEAKFSVNGELTQALGEGDTDTLSGGLQLGVRDILVNSREGVASFFLGADKVVFEDTSALVADDFSGSVEINNENINDGDVTILGANVSTTKFEITSIKYRLTMDAADGTTAYIPAGKGVKEFMKKPESLISDSLDIKYAGLSEPKRTDVEIKPAGDDEYKMTFTNIQGREYTFPLLSNEGGVWKFGDADDDLVFVEPAAITTTNVGMDDYVIVSNDRQSDTDKSVTNVLQYTDYDDDARTVEFEDVATGNSVTVSVNAGGSGSLVIGGHSYTVNVSSVSAAEPTLAIDLDGDGSFEANRVINITAWGGLVISPAHQVKNVSGTALTDPDSYTGSGVTMGTLQGTSGLVLMRATVPDDRFDTTGTDEVFTWTITQATAEVDLSFNSSSYDGPLANALFGDVDSFDFQDLEDNDDYQVGMSDYGILITEYNPSGSNSDPNELVLSVPEEQVTAQVFVTLGSVTQVKGGSGSADQVNPIAVGLAVLDSAAAGLVGSENLIVVGGPCANTVAAALLDNPEQCTEGFEEGKAVIRAWDKGSSVAILVAGYSAQDTQGASKVLAAYKDYSLSGSEVEVVVADLNSISVSPMG